MSYYSLPLKKKGLLKIWIHKIGRKNLPLNTSACVCSAHFNDSAGRRLQPDEYPTTNLPAITTPARKRKLPAERTNDAEVECEVTTINTLDDTSHTTTRGTVDHKEVATQTDETSAKYLQLETEIADLKLRLSKSIFRLSTIHDDDQKIHFYTGFSNYSTLKACYDYLGPAVDSLNYWGSEISGTTKSSCGRSRSLPPIEEYFLVLVRLRLGLFEKD